MPAVPDCDVAIVGGGLIGLLLALELRTRASGAATRVVVLERGDPGMQASFAAAGMLAPSIEAHAPGLLLELGLASRGLYPALADRLRAASGIDPGHRVCGALSLAFTPAEAAELEHRFRWQVIAGLSPELLQGDALRDAGAPGAALLGLWAREEAQVDNRALVEAARVSALRAGARILANTEVSGFVRVGGRCAGVTVSSDRRALAAGAVVLAGGAWSGLLATLCEAGLRRDAIVPVRGQLAALRPAAAAPDVAGPILFGAGGYLVPRRGRDGAPCVFAGSTMEAAGFDARTTSAGLARIRGLAAVLRPSLAGAPVVEHWAGLRPATADELPIVDELLPGLWMAAGHFRNGILLAPWTAQALASRLADEPGSAEALRGVSARRRTLDQANGWTGPLTDASIGS